MYRLSFIVLIVFTSLQSLAQSPHGDSLTLNCDECHTSKDWKSVGSDISFKHSSTSFELEGSHKAVDCKQCHTSLVFDDAATDCASCHTDIHSMSVGDDCASCHTPDNWLVDNIPELHEQNGFALVGSHALASCIDCHVSVNSMVFDRIGNECLNCHMDDYASTQNPNHATVGFSTNCIECHDPFATEWNSQIISHDFFPLVQGHDIDDCLQCHESNDYSSASPECVSCHQQNFNTTSNPNHTELGFSTDCIQCHSIAGWVPADFNHSKYPLNGAHTQVDCNACHNGDYTNTPNTCIACHTDDYNSANDPNHQQLNFSTDCLECHTENGWKPATFDHDGEYYPIYSGEHNNEWSLCSECHTNSSDYSVFRGIDCHEHNDRADLADEHRGVSNYVYQSNACYNCHPTGSE